MNKPKILYITPGLVPPSKDKQLSKFHALSKISKGAVLNPVWWKNKEELIKSLGPDAYPNFIVDDYEYSFMYLEKYPEYLHFIARVLFFVKEGLRLNKKYEGFDFIMTYGTNSTGLGALILKLLTGAKLITEIPGVPEDGSLLDEPKPSLMVKIKLLISNLLLNIILLKTDHLKLLYKDQLNAYPRAKNIPRSVFHDFVPTDNIQKIEPTDGNYIIAIGHPWYRKGLDILVEAFLKIHESTPNLLLKIVGWLPDRTYLDKLINNNPRIEILPPAPSNEIFKLISNSFALALTSRSEAMGRVLVEGMALKKPLLGSNTNGIPTYLIHERNGLLSSVGNIDELANNILRLYEDKQLRLKLGENGFQYLKEELDEDAYIRKYKKMLSS